MSAEPLDFATLRSRGIAWLQTLAGERWTDYNVHDPGVTLLETMVYGLTDLVYRVDFPTGDLLAGPDGLDLTALGLTPPERALPPRPSSQADVCAAVVAAVPELENAWLQPAAVGAEAGLLDLLVWSGPSLDSGDDRALLPQARAAYDAIRTVGEDVADVAFVGRVPCVLEGRLEVERDRDPAEIVAEIFDRCAARLDRGLEPVAVDALRRGAASLDDALSAPLGPLGVFTAAKAAFGMSPAALETDEGTAPDAFFGAVTDVDGVIFVEALGFRVSPRAVADPGAKVVAELVFPTEQADVDAFVLTSRGRRLQPEVGEVRRHLRRLRMERSHAARIAQDPAAVADPPPAQPRDLARYTLLQDHLPPAYGVTPQGLPRTAPVATRAKARQLRGYLLNVEQPLADAMATVDSLPRLFAREGGDRTYASAVGFGDLLPAVDRDLAPPDDGGALALRDDVFERRGRLLDYLLALYGEAFTQNSLRTFDVYRVGEERWRAVLANREAFLAAVETLTRDRGGGARLDDADDAGGFAQRLGVLLECRAPGPGTWLGAALAAHDLSLESTAVGERLARAELERPGDPFATVVPLTGRDGDEPWVTALAELRSMALLEPGPIAPAWLEAGVRIERYGLRPRGDGVELWLDDGDDDTVARLGAFPDRAAAIAAANGLRRVLIGLCRAGEGVHVVERVLLRPRAREAAASDDLSGRRFRIVVAASGWTPRTRQPDFRQLVAETVRLNAPAHVAPVCRWFETPDAMLAFEVAHAEWRDLLKRHLATPEDAALTLDLDAAAADVEARLEAATEKAP